MRVIKLHYHSKSRVLDVYFGNQQQAQFSAEFLRVHAPSADVQGHGKAKLVPNKKQVGISKLIPSGHYAVNIHFDDGHQSGLYSWQTLHHMSKNQDSMWDQYLNDLKQANASREPLITIKQL